MAAPGSGAEVLSRALRVAVCFSPAAGTVDEVTVSLAPGSTVAQAIDASGVAQRHPAFDLAAAGLGIWGRRANAGDALRDRDRVEIYRPLQVDPMEARRLRHRKQRGRPAPKHAR